MNREEINPADEKFRSIVLDIGTEAAELLARLIETASGDMDAFFEVLDSINAQAFSHKTSFVLIKIEELVSNDFPLLEFRHGWLSDALKDDLAKIEPAWRNLREAGLRLGHFGRQHEGIGGFVARTVNAYLNPLDGLLSIVGQGTVEKEAKQLCNKFGDCLTVVDHQLESLPMSIELHIASEVRRLEGTKKQGISLINWGLAAVVMYLLLRLSGVL